MYKFKGKVYEHWIKALNPPVLLNSSEPSEALIPSVDTPNISSPSFKVQHVIKLTGVCSASKCKTHLAYK